MWNETKKIDGRLEVWQLIGKFSVKLKDLKDKNILVLLMGQRNMLNIYFTRRKRGSELSLLNKAMVRNVKGIAHHRRPPRLSVSQAQADSPIYLESNCQYHASCEMLEVLMSQRDTCTQHGCHAWFLQLIVLSPCKPRGINCLTVIINNRILKVGTK